MSICNQSSQPSVGFRMGSRRFTRWYWYVISMQYYCIPDQRSVRPSHKWFLACQTAMILRASIRQHWDGPDARFWRICTDCVRCHQKLMIQNHRDQASHVETTCELSYCMGQNNVKRDVDLTLTCLPGTGMNACRQLNGTACHRKAARALPRCGVCRPAMIACRWLALAWRRPYSHVQFIHLVRTAASVQQQGWRLLRNTDKHT